MTIIQLEYFMAVANHGSFSAAAEYCFVTQPTLSTQISNLEEELGVLLFDRNSKPIVPTEAGKVVLEQARKVVAAFYGTREQVNNLKGDVSGKLRLGVIPTISPYLMPPLVLEFRKRFPDVKITINDMFTADLIDALNRDLIDIAIMSGGESVVKIKETELFDDKLYLYVSPQNEFFGRNTPIGIEEIDVSTLLILSNGNCLRNQTLKLCQARKNINPDYDFAASSIETLMRAVDMLGGTTIIPGMAIGCIPEERRKQIKAFAHVNARRKITMAVSHTFVKAAIVDAVHESIMAVREEFAIAEFLIP